MQRRLQPELMDDPALNADVRAGALRGLRRINAVSGTVRFVWNAIARIAKARGLQSFRVLDVACGGGDLLLGLQKRARAAGLDVAWCGCDISPAAVAYAAESTGNGSNIQFFVADAVNEPLPDEYDFVISTMFLHHLETADAVRLLGNMRVAARHAVVVDDLGRSRLGWLLATVGCRLLSRNAIVHHDGPVSVEGAFTPDEACELAGQAGMAGVHRGTHWPCRYLLAWQRD